MKLILIPDLGLGHEEIWLLGDETLARHGATFERKTSTYTASNFQIRIIASTAVTSHNPDPIARIRNSLIQAWQKFNCIPKIIAVIPENDIIRAIKTTGVMAEVHYAKAVEWIADEHVKITDYFKKHATAKQLKNRRFWPFYMWIAASIHDRYSDYSRRVRFNRALDNTSKIHPRMSMLKPIQNWSAQDAAFVSNLDRNLTSDGWISFWNSVDSAISYFDSKIIPNIIENKENKNRNPYHYRRESAPGHLRRRDSDNGANRRTISYKNDPESNRRRLPTPPSKRQ